MDGIPPSPYRYHTPSLPYRFLSAIVLAICFLLILHTYFLEPFQIPTGSMAPTLLGHHRSGICPSCGIMVNVGRTHADGDGSGGERCYAQACCPNCGCQELHLGKAPETQGDHVLVNKSVYALRTPRRWEIIVFRLFGKTFIKRLIGLGGEEIEIIDGDVYVDGQLVRKTIEEFLGMRVLVFDNHFAPKPDGRQNRWEYKPDHNFSLSSQQMLLLDGRITPQQLTYRHFSTQENKCQPLVDEYAYNGGRQAASEPVHDFMVEAEVEIREGKGAMTFALNDGGVEVEVELGVEEFRETFVRVYPFEPEELSASLRRSARIAEVDIENMQKVRLVKGKRYHIEMALVDRRLTMRVEGIEVFPPVDLPPARERSPVMRPMRFTADGLLACFHQVRLYRDVHYTQAGKNAVRGRPVRLGINQTFVLGDNSANSEDSRFWPNQGAVPTPNIVGRAFLVHLPNQVVTWEGWGRQWRYQFPDWEHMRRLR